MKIPFFDYRRYLEKHRKEIEEAIKDVLNSGHLVNGPHVCRFERSFADYTGAKHSVSVASGTDALFLSLKALGIGAGDEVVTVPNTAVPTVSAIVSAGAIPRFADIFPNTCLMDPVSAERLITKKTKAIVPVHLFGQSADMQRIMDLADYYKLSIVEDCAQAHGTQYKNVHVGNFGSCGCFSFYPTKNLGAFGDGGMIITSSKSLYKKLCLLKNYGENSKHENKMHGYNSRLDEIQAAILLVKLRNLDECNRKRVNLAACYDEKLKETGVVTLRKNQDSTHVYHQYVIQVKKRNFVRKLLADEGIATGIHYPRPIYLQKAYAYLGTTRGACPVSERIQNSILSLPIFPELSQEEIGFISSKLRTVLKKLKL